MKGLTEEIAFRYYQKLGYLVSSDVLFPLRRERTGKQASGWSDIDIIAYKHGELLIIQCKSFLGTTKNIESANKIIHWFKHAENFVRNTEPYKTLCQNSVLKKVLVVEVEQPKGAIRLVKDSGIEIKFLDKNIKELFRLVEEWQNKLPERTVGKEEDIILNFIKKQLEMGMKI